MTDAPSTAIPPQHAAATTPPPDAQTTDAGLADTAKAATGTAKEQASKLGGSAADSAGRVAGTARDEAAGVASEAKQQAKALYGEATTQLREQASTQQARAAEGLHGIGGDLSSMAQSSEQQGLASELVSQIASRASGVATWLESREPADVLDEVKRYARRKPGTFIALCAVAGLVAGRLVRSLASEAKDEQDAKEQAQAPSHAAAGATSVPTTSGSETSPGIPVDGLDDGLGRPRPAHAAPAPFVDAPPPPAPGTRLDDGVQR